MRPATFLLNLLLLLALASCGQQSDLSAPQSPAVQPTGLGNLLPAPRTLVARSAAYTAADLVRDGADFELSQHATAAGNSAVFSPDYVPGAELNTLAYGIYRFTLEDYDLQPYIFLKWDYSPDFEDTFIGVADFTRNSWRWYRSYTSIELTPEQMAAALDNPASELVVVVASLGSAESSLRSVHVSGNTGELTLDGIHMSPSQEDYSVYADEPITFTADVTGNPDTYSWSFRDNPGLLNIYSAAQSPVITFTQAGSYFVTLWVGNADGFANLTTNMYVEVLPKPVIEDVDYDDPFEGMEMHLDPFLSSYEGDETYLWDFGGAADPNTSTELDPYITPLAVGQYNISLTATNSYGSDTYEFVLDVRDPETPPDIIGVEIDSSLDGDNLPGPVPGASMDLRIINAGGYIDNSSDAIDWDLGGGGLPNEILDEAFPESIALWQDDYNASVTVTTPYGTDTFTWTLSIGDPGHDRPIIVAFEPGAGESDEAVTFTALNVGEPATSWEWDFSGSTYGDWATPASSTEESPTVTLGTSGPSGIAPLEVTASNAAGSSTFADTFFIF